MMIRSLKTKITKQTVAIAAALGCASLGGYYAARAATPLVITPVPLYYTGFLSQSGTPINAPDRDLEITLYSTQNSTTALDCKSAVPGHVAVVGGHFSVSLIGDCTGVLQTNRNAYVEVKDGGTAIGARQAVGASPYSYISAQADNATTANSATTAADATHATNADNVPLAGVTGLAAQLAALHAGPTILGPTTVDTDGTGVNLSTGTGPGGYSDLTTLCQANWGASAFPCTLSDATKSMARGLIGTSGMGTTSWVIGGTPDCDGFTDNSAGLNGSAINFVNVSVANRKIRPVASTCDSQQKVLCCAYQ